jgi:small subunit ribosomal protein S13
MQYFLNKEIPEKKSVINGLTHVFGFGKTKSLNICEIFGLSKKTKIEHLNQNFRTKIIKYVTKNIKINDELIQSINQATEKEIKIKSYKGQRIKLKLPRRGQRTKTNAKTIKKLK